MRYRVTANSIHEKINELAKPIKDKVQFVQFKTDLYKSPGMCNKDIEEIKQLIEKVQPHALALFNERDEYSSKANLMAQTAWEICYDLVGRSNDGEKCDCIGKRKGWLLVALNHNHDEHLPNIVGAIAIGFSNSRPRGEAEVPDFDDYSEFFDKNKDIM